MTNHSNNVQQALQEYLLNQSSWKTIARWLLISLGVSILVAWFGKDMIEEIEVAEDWIEGHGSLGWVVFIGLLVIATSLFVPLSVMRSRAERCSESLGARF